MIAFKEKIENEENENLLNIIEDNCVIARNFRNEIRKSKILQSQKTDVDFQDEQVAKEKSLSQETTIVDEFEEQIKYYLEDYKKLEIDFSDDDLYDILPSKKTSRYKDIMLRLIAESIKEIKQLNEFYKEDNFNKEEIEDIKSLIIHEQRKIKLIKEKLNEKEEVNNESKEQEKNNVVFAPTPGGNIRVIDELENIPPDYYPLFKDLLDSIIDGTFKGVRVLKYPANGIAEVKGHGVRILFKRISKKTYAVISAFIKRRTIDNGYRETLCLKASDFRAVHETLKSKCNDPEFMKENEMYLQEVYNILEQNDKNPQMNKGVK